MEYKINGPFEKIIPEFVRYKKALGFKYDSISKYENINNFFKQYGVKKIIITKDMYYKYIFQDDNQYTQFTRYMAIRELCLYLIKKGYKNIYVEDMHFNSRPKYEPHIYSKYEIDKLIQTIDNYNYEKDANDKYVFPIMFRLLYSCGLRISEVLNLKYRDVNFESGCIKIIYSKDNVSRIIVVSDTMKTCLLKYKNKMTFSEESYLFHNSNNKKYSYICVNNYFKDFINDANIKVNKIHIHDLRHTFTVNTLDRQIRKGKTAENILTYLNKYMGHKKMKTTEYYLHMTTNKKRNILIKSKKYCSDLIPKIGDENGK